MDISKDQPLYPLPHPMSQVLLYSQFCFIDNDEDASKLTSSVECVRLRLCLH
jgi:hypothetical protein